MPLIDEIKNEVLTFEGVLNDGTKYKDIYTLKGALSYYDDTKLKLAGMSLGDIRVLAESVKKAKSEEGENGEDTDTDDPQGHLSEVGQNIVNDDHEAGQENRQVTLDPGELVAVSNTHRIHAWLVSWSHDRAITIENIKLIPDEQGKVILKKIEQLESVQARPFQEQSESKGLYKQHSQG